jgi:hypothetical protein
VTTAKRKTQPANRKQHEVATATVPSQPQWVRSAQEHFHQTGYYRPEDLYRVAGDPRGSVEVTLTSDVELACRVLT